MKHKSIKKQHPKRFRVGEYQQYKEIGEHYGTKHKKLELMVPSNLRLLCVILDVKIEVVLHDFMWMLSYSSIKNASRKKRDAARKFFLRCGYGKPRYSGKQINTMLDELEAVRKIYDTTESMERDDLELFWKNRNMYTEFWFKRWYGKDSRPDALAALKEN